MLWPSHPHVMKGMYKKDALVTHVIDSKLDRESTCEYLH